MKQPSLAKTCHWFLTQPTDFRQIPGIREAFGLIGLTVAGVFGNYLNIEIFFGVNFIFGSIATMVAVRTSGTLWGTLVGIAIGSYTYILWGHPYAIIIFGLEAFTVGFVTCFLKKDNMVLADTLFWLFAGMPLAWVLYSYPLGLPETAVDLILVKQGINGITNTLAASLLIQFGIGSLISGKTESHRWSLNVIINNTLATFILIPMLLVITIANTQKMGEIEMELSQATRQWSTHISNILNNALWERSVVLKTLVSEVLPDHPRESWTSEIGQWQRGLTPNLISLEITNAQGVIEYAYPTKRAGISRYAEQITGIDSDHYRLINLQQDQDEQVNMAHFDLAIPLSDTRYLFASISSHSLNDPLDRALSKFKTFELIDRHGNTLYSSSKQIPYDYIYGDNPHYILPANEALPAMARWQKAYWESTTKLDLNSAWLVKFRIPMEKSIEQLQTDYAKKMFTTLAAMIIALCLAPIMSRRLTGPLFGLTTTIAKLTKDSSRTDANWPDSKIYEIRMLANQFQSLIDTVHQEQSKLHHARLQEQTIADELVQLINTANAPIFGVDTEGNVDEWNQTMERITGYIKPEVMGRNLVVNFIVDEFKSTVEAVLDKSLKGTETANCEFHLRVKDGGRVIVLLNSTTRRDTGGKIVGVISVGQDITERKRVENALKESEARLLALAEASPAAIYLKDLDGQFLLASRAYRNWYGAQGDVRRKTVYDFFPEEDADMYTAHDREVIECRKSLEWEINVPSPSGKCLVVHSVQFPIFGSDGELTGIGGINMDITESKAAAAQIIQASKLSTLGEMATSVAHELNQPLSVIRMAAGNSLRKISNGSAKYEYLTGKLERISTQAERAAAIITHMQMFGRKASEEPCPIDPCDMVRGALGLMGEQLRLAEIDIKTELPEDCPSVKGHLIQTEQVILNLLTNARDAIQSYDQLKEKRIRLAVETEDSENIKVIVEDTGGGIPDNVVERIFEPFFTTKEIGMGTGLGLSVSYGIVRDMGGTIEAVSYTHL
ncbi:MAG TPA: PAS domain S-box protein, partial [bacterium]|nr:PAS domain S-box protein [bacterium]